MVPTKYSTRICHVESYHMIYDYPCLRSSIIDTCLTCPRREKSRSPDRPRRFDPRKLRRSESPEPVPLLGSSKENRAANTPAGPLFQASLPQTLLCTCTQSALQGPTLQRRDGDQLIVPPLYLLLCPTPLPNTLPRGFCAPRQEKWFGFAFRKGMDMHLVWM